MDRGDHLGSVPRRRRDPLDRAGADVADREDTRAAAFERELVGPRIRAGDDKPFVLELNPNPDFAPDRALSNNLWAADFTHAEFTLHLVKNALARRGASGPQRYRTERQAG